VALPPLAKYFYLHNDLQNNIKMKTTTKPYLKIVRFNLMLR
jgi:hypothetical protein